MSKYLLRVLHPPCGVHVRRMVGAITLAVALPRLSIWPGAPVVYPLQFLPQEAFGWLTLTAAILLLLTNYERRVRLIGRLSAFFALAVWSLLAAATTSSTSLMIDLIIVYAMLGEIVAMHHDDC